MAAAKRSTLKISTIDVWAARLNDAPGSLAAKLEALARAGINLESLIARRTPETPGSGVVYTTPIEGARQAKAARAAGFEKTTALRSVRVEGRNRAGLGAKVTTALASAGLNLRGVSGAALGQNAVLYIALDNKSDADRAVKILKALK
ncbi:MAG TPA: ACT domain-containing protein [Polyangiaceae bacterium]|jgi:hypothetical protein